jgi:hypothetical protein
MILQIHPKLAFAFAEFGERLNILPPLAHIGSIDSRLQRFAEEEEALYQHQLIKRPYQLLAIVGHVVRNIPETATG